MHPFNMHALLRSALVPKGCNFIAPLALIQQFLIALFLHFQPTVQDDGVIHKELCFSSSSSGRPNLKGQVCKLASRNGNFFPRLIFCSLKQKVAALLHFTVPLCFCVEVVGATTKLLGFLIHFRKLSSEIEMCDELLFL